MLTPCKVSSCKVCSSAAEGEGSLGIPPQTWDFFAPRIPAPVLWLHWAGASGCRAFSSCPSTETKGSAPQRTSQPRRCGRCQFCSWFWEACGSGTRRKEVPINREGVTDLRLEDRTTESTVRAEEESQSTTTLNVVTSHPTEKVGEDTETTVEKDGLATVTLVGIIVGVLLAIGFIGGIIIVVARKMSGRP
uniref:Podoplanin n=1 Tax=Ursus maritimus TaxID=29073 RepID=A0A452V9C7_URSMA